LDQCYTGIKEAYYSVPRAALGLSDHLIPTYRQKLKSAKPVLRTVKRWTNEAEQDLKAFFDLNDWTVFEAAATDLDELTETVTSYISFCEDMCIPTRTHSTYNNAKPWFTAKLSSVRPKKILTERGIKSCINRPNAHWKRRSEWQRIILVSYRYKLSSSDSASMWKGMENITRYKTPSSSTLEN